MLHKSQQNHVKSPKFVNLLLYAQFNTLPYKFRLHRLKTIILVAFNQFSKQISL